MIVGLFALGALPALCLLWAHHSRALAAPPPPAQGYNEQYEHRAESSARHGTREHGAY
jgi:hypothetical protein